MTAPATTPSGSWIEDSDCVLDDLHALVSRDTDPADYPAATDVRAGVLMYSAEAVAHTDRRALQAELLRALADGLSPTDLDGALAAQHERRIP